MTRSRSQLAVAVTPIDSIRDALQRAVAGDSIELLPMPQVANRIIAMAFDATSDAAQLAQLIQRDQMLAGHVMRIANSAIYRPRTPAVSLQQAIAWLGMSEVQNVAVALAIRGQVFRAPGHQADVEELWRESIAAAVWAQTIAKRRSTEADVAYLCGLLHTIGRTAVLRLLSQVEGNHGMVCDARTSSVLLDEFELACAEHVVKDWRLPERIATAVLNWRSYERLGVHRQEAATTHAARQLATASLHPDLLQPDYLLSNPVFAELGLSAEPLDELLGHSEVIRRLIAEF